MTVGWWWIRGVAARVSLHPSVRICVGLLYSYFPLFVCALYSFLRTVVCGGGGGPFCIFSFLFYVLIFPADRGLRGWWRAT